MLSKPQAAKYFHNILIWPLSIVLPLFFMGTALAATTIPFTINVSEPVTVTGTPRIAVDVGGITRHATYVSGTGTAALIFTYSATTGDVDLNGVTLASPIDLNGGTIKDLNGNNATLTFTPPDTSNALVNFPSLGIDFVVDADGRYTLNGTVHNDLNSFLGAVGGTFTRASVGTYFDSTGTMQTASSGTPRFDYDPNTHTAIGLLIEESRTNLIRYSTNFQSGWTTLGGASITVNSTIAPDGTTTASTLTATNTGQNRIEQSSASAGVNYTYSLYVKKGTGRWIGLGYWAGSTAGDQGAKFDLDTLSTSVYGTEVSNPKIISLPNGWKRISANFTASAVVSGLKILLSDNSNVLNNTTTGIYSYIWGAQIEQGGFATSYIPTTSAATTRAADQISIPSSSWIGATTETIIAEVDTNVPQSNWASIFSHGLTYSGNRYLLVGSNGTITGGHSGANITTAISATPNTTFKAGTTFGPSSTLTSLNGTITTGSTVGRGSPSNTGIGAGNGQYLNGHLHWLKYYPTHIANTQLQLLTQ